MGCDVYFSLHLSGVFQFFFNTMILSLPPKRLLPRLPVSRAPVLLVKNSHTHTELTTCEVQL